MSSAKRSRSDRGDPGGDAGPSDRLDVAQRIRAAVERDAASKEPEALLDELCDKWELDARDSTLDAFSRLAFENFGVSADGDITTAEGDTYGMRALDECVEFHEQQAIRLFNTLRTRDPGGERPELQRRAAKVIEMVYYAKRLVFSAMQARLGVKQLHSSAWELAEDMDKLLGSWALRFRYIDQTKVNALQKLLLHLLDTAMEKRYRKHNGWVYEPIVVDGHETHAWRRVMEIKDFVYDATPKEMDTDQWLNLTNSGGNAKMATEHLSAANDFQFPFLRKNRTVFSFRNGVYLAHEDRFHCFATAREPLSDTVVAAKYFDAEFDEFAGAASWRDIPTPHLESIMLYQEWEDPEVRAWMYRLLGRLLYPVGEKGLDGWQVLPYLLGAASSGKSTISLKVAKAFYDPADVGVLSNNVEKQVRAKAAGGARAGGECALRPRAR